MGSFDGQVVKATTGLGDTYVMQLKGVRLDGTYSRTAKGSGTITLDK